MKLLIQDKIKSKEMKRRYVEKLFIFIDHLMRLPQDIEQTLFQELKPLIEKEEARMGLSWEGTSFAWYFRNEGKEEGIVEGKVAGKAEGRAEGITLGKKQKAIEIAVRLLRKGFSVEEVAEDTGLTLEEVWKIKREE